jgi:putative addiction module killer protein
MAAPAKLIVREYASADGRNPFREWLSALDVATRARIQARVFRFETGNLGDHKTVGAGVFEARIMFGPGYRIYFGRHGRDLVVLLLGGHKASQARDIRRAQEFWADYLRANRHGTKK